MRRGGKERNAPGFYNMDAPIGAACRAESIDECGVGCDNRSLS